MAAPSAIGMMVGFLLLLIAAARAGKPPWWPVAALPVGLVVSFQPALVRALIGSGVMMVVLTMIGRTCAPPTRSGRPEPDRRRIPPTISA